MSEDGVSLVRSLSSIVDLPDDHALDVDAIHFIGNLLRFEGDQLRSGREFNDLVVWGFEATESDLSSLQFTIICDKYPLISLSGDLESLHVFQ